VTKAIALGAVLLLAGMVWRMFVARRQRARIAVALDSADPNVRAVALRRISRSGVAPYAEQLLAMTRQPLDPVRHGELAWLIASTQWEPARDARVAQLRLWADSQYQRTREAQEPTVTEQGIALATPSAPAAQPVDAGIGGQRGWEGETPDLHERVDPTAGPSNNDGNQTPRDPHPVAPAPPDIPWRGGVPRTSAGPSGVPAFLVTAAALEDVASRPPLLSRYLPPSRIAPTTHRGHDGNGAQHQSTAGGSIAEPTRAPLLVVAVENLLGEEVLWLDYEPIPSVAGYLHERR
jgi:hypothetical protein